MTLVQGLSHLQLAITQAAGRDKDADCKFLHLVALSTQNWLEDRGNLNYWYVEVLNILVWGFPGAGKQSYANWNTGRRMRS
jgi:hypothetical protein